jgi:hypothetical protein
MTEADLHSGFIPAAAAVRRPKSEVRRRSLAAAVLGVFSSVWTGVIFMALLFVYCSIGSAIPAVRQLPMLEMTEFEWFHWWPFDVLVALFCLCMMVATVRRIPLRLVNAGVWTIHTGIIVLALGSYWYFGTKLEGDAPVFRRQVRIELPGLDEPASLVALPQAATTVHTPQGPWQFVIESTNHSWPILSDEHKGEKAYAVNVAVTTPDGRSFIRQLLDGYPQYTEDILPGQGRAIKAIGRKLVDESLRLSLAYEPQTYFHLQDTWALFIRRAGETKWHQRPIEGMPRYHERISERDWVFADHDLPIRPTDIEVPARNADDSREGATVRVTGYLRHAVMRSTWVNEGSKFNPVLRLSLMFSDGTSESYDLVAFDPAHSRFGNGFGHFVWLEDPAGLAAFDRDPTARLTVNVPEADFELELPLTREVVTGDSGPFRPIEGTEYSFRVRNLADNLALARGTVSVAMVDIRTPEGEFMRMVADRPEMTKDLADSGDPHQTGPTASKRLDPRFEMTYRPGLPPLILAASPAGVHLIYSGDESRGLSRPVGIGEQVELAEGVFARVEALYTHAVLEEKPYVVPPEQRDRDMRESLSMVRLEVASGGRRQIQWLKYHPYVFENDQYAATGRFRFEPTVIQAPSGKPVEVLFSRQRLPLPHPIALSDFRLRTHVGGYTGSVATIRNYVSALRVQRDGEWSAPREIEVNDPTTFGKYWYFQSTWDPPSSTDAGGGMNFTGLGVGNRNGVYVQLVGCFLAVAGMIFAFYVKPIIKRRRAGHARAKLEMAHGIAV